MASMPSTLVPTTPAKCQINLRCCSSIDEQLLDAPYSQFNYTAYEWKDNYQRGANMVYVDGYA